MGEDQFIAETVEAGIITAKKLCTAFGIRPPFFLDGQPDDAFYPLLGLGICRELQKRVKLAQYNTIDDAVSLLNKSKNIIVLTGAGVRHQHIELVSKLSCIDFNQPRNSRLPI